MANTTSLLSLSAKTGSCFGQSAFTLVAIMSKLSQPTSKRNCLDNLKENNAIILLNFFYCTINYHFLKNFWKFSIVFSFYSYLVTRFWCVSPLNFPKLARFPVLPESQLGFSTFLIKMSWYYVKNRQKNSCFSNVSFQRCLLGGALGKISRQSRRAIWLVAIFRYTLKGNRAKQTEMNRSYMYFLWLLVWIMP